MQVRVLTEIEGKVFVILRLFVRVFGQPLWYRIVEGDVPLSPAKLDTTVKGNFAEALTHGMSQTRFPTWRGGA